MNNNDIASDIQAQHNPVVKKLLYASSSVTNYIKGLVDTRETTLPMDATQPAVFTSPVTITFNEYFTGLPNEFFSSGKNYFTSIGPAFKDMFESPIKGFCKLWIDCIGKENVLAFSLSLTVIFAILLLSFYVVNKRNEKVGACLVHITTCYGLLTVFLKFLVFGSLLLVTYDDTPNTHLSDLFKHKELFFFIFLVDLFLVIYTFLLSSKYKGVFGVKKYFLKLVQGFIIFSLFCILRPLLNRLTDTTIRIIVCYTILVLSTLVSINICSFWDKSNTLDKKDAYY